MLRILGEVSVFLGLFGALFLITGPSQLLHKTRGITIKIRKTKELNPSGGKFPKISTTCKIPELQVPTKKVQPTFLTTYPGAGTKLQWELVEALTGIVTTDDAFSNGHHNVIGIKTHFPCPAGREFPGAENVMRAIMFVRHPMDTLPAYYDIIYASEKDKPYDNPDPAPLEDWIEWRDLAFARELEVWRKHFVYWMERYSTLNRFVVQYEKLIDRAHGPDIVMDMADFLSRGMGVTVPDEEDIPCIWKKIIDKVFAKGSAQTRRLRRRLQQMMSQTSTGLPLMPGPQLLGPNEGQQQQNYQQHQMPMGQMGNEQTSMSGQMGIDPRQVMQMGSQLQMMPMNPQMSVQSQQMPLQQQNGVLYQQALPQFTSLNGMATSNGNGLPTFNGMSLATDANKMPLTNEHGLFTPMLAGQSMASQTAEAQGVPSGMESSSTLLNTGDEGMASSSAGDSRNSDGGGVMSLVDSQMRSANEDTQADDEEDDEEKTEDSDENGAERTQGGDNIEVAVPASQVGTHRPYTEGQRKEIVIVLAQLLEKYRDDNAITPILVEYIDQVERRHQKDGNARF